MRFELEKLLIRRKLRKRQINFSNCTPVMDHECRHFKSEREMCRWWGVTSETYRYRRKQGFSKQEALTMPMRKAGGRKKND